MTRKSLLVVAVLALATISVASAKTYDVVISAPMKVGSVQLTPGEYKMTVDDADVVFTDMQTHKSVAVAVQIENANKKYKSTEIDTGKQGDVEQIKTIELGGTTTKLEFGQ
jgi:hypothetical protein